MTATASQIDRIRTKPLGARSPYVRDNRRAQSVPQITQPTTEQIATTQRALGVDRYEKSAERTMLCHSCFGQRQGQTKPRDCGCDTYIEYWRARELINKGCADFLIYKRAGREQENRKSIVLTADYLRKQAASQDAFNKLPYSITKFIDSTTGYHLAPITDEATSGLDKAINDVRRATIAERKMEVEANRRHRVTPKGNSIDSDSSRDDMGNGQGVGQMDSIPDVDSGKNLAQSLDYNPGPPRGSIQERIENRNLPKPIDEVVSEQEENEFLEECSETETTIMTGRDAACTTPVEAFMARKPVAARS